MAGYFRHTISLKVRNAHCTYREGLETSTCQTTSFTLNGVISSFKFAAPNGPVNTTSLLETKLELRSEIHTFTSG